MCLNAGFGLDQSACGAQCMCICVCMRVLTVARETGCPGVVLGSCPNQETQARCPVQGSSSDKKAISVSYSVLSFPPFSFL